MISSPKQAGIIARPVIPLIGKSCRVQSQPGGALISVDTTDFEEFCDFAAGWNLDHQLVGRQKPHITMTAVVTGNFQLGIVKQEGGYCSQGTNPKGTTSIVVPLDEKRPMIHCGRDIEPRQMAIADCGNGFELINRFGANHLLATFSQRRMEQYAADCWNESSFRGQLSTRLQFLDLAHGQRYVEVCKTALKDIQKQPGLLSDTRCALQLEERLLEILLLQGSINRLVSNDRSRYQVARRAYRYLLEEMDEVPSIRKICAITGASYATLERGYREIYGMAPQVHIKALRLSRARKELRQPGANTTVTDVAVRWGFFELGRFAVQYRHRFGEMPSDTLRKARGDSRPCRKDRPTAANVR